MRALIDDQEEKLENGPDKELQPEESQAGRGENREEDSEDWEDDWDDLEERMAENLAHIKAQTSRRTEETAQEESDIRVQAEETQSETREEDWQETAAAAETEEISETDNSERILEKAEAEKTQEDELSEEKEAPHLEDSESIKTGEMEIPPIFDKITVDGQESVPEKKKGLRALFSRKSEEHKKDKEKVPPVPLKERIKGSARKIKSGALTLKDRVVNWYEGTSHLEEGQDELSAYRTRIWLNRRKTIIRRTGIVIGILLAFFVVKTVIDHWHYGSYEVLSSSSKEGSSSQYLEVDGNLLRYSADGVSMIDGKETTLWTDTYDMTSPAVDVCQGTVAVYDQRGSQISVYNSQGHLGSISAEYPILKVRVAQQGVVAAMLEDGENTWLNVYSASGEKLVTSKTRVDSPGYPVSFDLSEDGMLMAVSYLYVEGGSSTTKLVFYNFGSVGQNQTDNIVKETDYPDQIIPEVAYLDSSTALVFRDDGFSIYTGPQIPDETRTVEIEDEIVSAFWDENNIGVILHSQDTESNYTLRVYGTNGKIKFEENFDIEYTTAKISGDNILLYNDSELCVYSMKGVERFCESIEEGEIQDIFKVDSNRYIAVLSTGITTFKLK